MQEKRALRRYRLNLPAVISWIDGERQTCGGFTRDISVKGAFVLCNGQLPTNTAVEIEILLPTSGGLPGTAVRTKARVVRAHEKSELVGFAVEGQFGQPECLDEFTDLTLQ